MVINLAFKYSAGNISALQELIGLGYETLLDYAFKNLTTDAAEAKISGKTLLTLTLINSKDFRLTIFSILKNRLRNYTVRMSSYSETFPDIYAEKRERKYTASSYGSLAASNADAMSLPGEYCPVELCDERCAADFEMIELLADASRFLEPKQLEMLVLRLNGASIKEIAHEYAISSPAVTQKLNKIAKKLMPLAESIKAA